MPEWSIGAVSKTVDQLAWSQGSNPCLSAKVKNEDVALRHPRGFYMKKTFCFLKVDSSMGW